MKSSKLFSIFLPLPLFVCLTLWLALSQIGYGQAVEIIVSSQAGDRLTRKPAAIFERKKEISPIQFKLNPEEKFQTIAGFGASFLEAGLICLNSLLPADQERVLEALFDPGKGAGFSAMKTVLAGTDFMSAGPWYTYNDTPGDMAMKKFSIQRDLGPNGLISFIKRARRYGNFVLQAPMDYPPDWMLFDVQKNQDVDPKYFDALALYYLRYLQGYQKNGIFVDYLSLFNEPGIYTKIPYDKIRDLLKNHVGPLFEREGIKTRIQLSEAEYRQRAAQKYPLIMDDPQARKYVAGLPYHGYDMKNFADILALHKKYPYVPLWMTEICYAYEAGTPKSMRLPRYDFEDGDFWAQQIFSDLEAYASAWLYWNMILDQKGGPWLTSPIHGNPDPNVQHPVVIVDREKRQVTYTGLYYYLAHFSKFVRPGAVRIEVSGRAPKIRCLSFQSPKGQIVAELLNSSHSSTSVNLEFKGKILKVVLPPVSITTCLWQAW
jgi:glucosylceramidase